MNVDGWSGRGRPKKRWMDYVTNDMFEKRVDDANLANREEWKKMMLRQPQIRWDTGRNMMIMMTAELLNHTCNSSLKYCKLKTNNKHSKFHMKSSNDSVSDVDVGLKYKTYTNK